jgi:SAM-dependent methyltransferase
MRKAKEFNLKNIKFFQADILQLGQMNERFDIINCSGVLHHMKDPAAGLQVLAGLLKPTGFMELGFYSEYARKDVVKTADIIKEKGFTTDPQGIRACRRYIKNTDDSQFAFIKGTSDFFSISTCRDLIFHIQETRYTLPQLNTMLAGAGLSLSRFILAGYKLDQYKAAFPYDYAANDLENWDKFEQDNPDFFRGMYQFTVKKH